MINFLEFIRCFSQKESSSLNQVDPLLRNLLFETTINDELGPSKALIKLFPQMINQLDVESHTPLSLCIL